MKRNVTTLGALAALLALGTACDDGPTGPELLHVVQDTLFAIGDFAELQVRVTGSTSGAPRWSSLDPQILSVTPLGVARGLSAGSARVQVEVGGKSAQGTITVLPDTEVRLTSVTLESEEDGSEALTLGIRNDAGRGYYRFRMYRDGHDGGLPVLVWNDLNDQTADHGLDLSFQTWLQPPSPGVRPVDFVVVVSRGAHELGARETSCLRIDGQACGAH